MDTRDPLKASSEQAERLHRFAHDLRNRLATIREVLSQLRVTNTDPGSIELHEVGEQQYFKAMRATEELLDDLHVDRGIRLYRSIPVALAPLLERAIAEQKPRFERKSQHASISLQKELMVMGDDHWLHEIMIALLSNASKFSQPNGRIRIDLSKQGAQAIVTVADDGVGLEPADLGMIFHRYAWLSSKSTAGEAQGRSTLGRVKQWVEAHGGSLTVGSSGTGKGATFILSLPLASETAS